MDYDPKTMPTEPTFFVENGTETLGYYGLPRPVAKTNNTNSSYQLSNIFLTRLRNISKVEIHPDTISIFSVIGEWSVTVPNTPKLYGELQDILQEHST